MVVMVDCHNYVYYTRLCHSRQEPNTGNIGYQSFYISPETSTLSSLSCLFNDVTALPEMSLLIFFCYVPDFDVIFI